MRLLLLSLLLGLALLHRSIRVLLVSRRSLLVRRLGLPKVVIRCLVAVPICRLRLCYRDFLRRFIGNLVLLPGLYLCGRGVQVLGDHRRFLGGGGLAVPALAINGFLMK